MGLRRADGRRVARDRGGRLTAAVAAVQVFNIPERSIRNGLKKAEWPGRFEIVSEKPTIILDGAHNPEGMSCFVETYEHLFEKPPIVILGIKRTKEVKQIINKIARIAKHIIITDSQFQAMPAKKLKAEVEKYNSSIDVIQNSKEAMFKAQRISSSDDIICVTGSLYLVGDVRGIFHL